MGDFGTFDWGIVGLLGAATLGAGAVLADGWRRQKPTAVELGLLGLTVAVFGVTMWQPWRPEVR